LSSLRPLQPFNDFGRITKMLAKLQYLSRARASWDTWEHSLGALYQ
jgi:hypothetical protein